MKTLTISVTLNAKGGSLSSTKMGVCVCICLNRINIRLASSYEKSIAKAKHKQQSHVTLQPTFHWKRKHDSRFARQLIHFAQPVWCLDPTPRPPTHPPAQGGKSAPTPKRPTPSPPFPRISFVFEALCPVEHS